ncbi:MAG: hypothetical protein J5528_04935 [Firmicutes bacterium]|nr:hypothetical protein [Bacillota bacterium]
MKITAHMINLLIYIAYFAGLSLILSNVLAYLKGRITLRRRLMSMKNRAPGALESKLDSIVFMATGKEHKGKLLGLASLLLFAVSFLYSILSFGIFFSLIIALLVASVPLISLVSKIQNQRSRSSREGQSFVNELYRQYLIGNRNILVALEKTFENGNEFPSCRKQAYLLLLRMRSSGSRSAVKTACSDFASAIGSLWAKNVASAVMSAYEGFDITEALIDITAGLELVKEDSEEKKRLNGEAARMTVFLVPAMYVSTLAMAVGILGMDIKDLLYNQFSDRIGLMLFLIIILMFFINCMLLSIMNGSNADY